MTPGRILALAAAVVLSGTIASAASLTMTTTTLGAGTAGVAACDSSFALSHTTTDGRVTSVTVSDVADPACEGGRLSLALTKAGVRVGEGGPVTIPADADTDANSLTVTVADPPLASDVDGYRIVISGP